MKLATAKLLIALFVAAAFQAVLWLAPGFEAPAVYANHGLPHASVTLWPLSEASNPVGFNPTDTDDDIGGVTGHVATSTNKLSIVTIINNSLHPNGRANGIVFWNPATNAFKSYAVVPSGFSNGIDVNLRAPVLTGDGRTFGPGDVWVTVQAPDVGGPLYVNFKGSDVFRQYRLVDAAGAVNDVKSVAVDQTTGHIYFVEENPPGTIDRLNPATNEWTRWDVGGIPGNITLDSSGRVYATVSQSTLTGGSDAIVRLEPAANQATAWSVGSNKFCPGQCPVAAGAPPLQDTPNGIDLDGAGQVWFVESQANAVGRLEPASNRLTEFTGVDPGAPPGVKPGVKNPQQIAARGSGTTVEAFFTEGDGDATSRVIPQTSSGPLVVTTVVQTLTPSTLTATHDPDETITPQRVTIKPTVTNVASRAAGPEIVRFPMPTPRGGKTGSPLHPSGLTDVTSKLITFGTLLDPERAGNSAVFRVFDPVDLPLPDPTPLLAPLLGWQRVTGAGTIAVLGGKKATFALAVDREQAGAVPEGRLRYQNQANGDNVVSTSIGSVTVVGNTATIDGTCLNNGLPCTFTLAVQDTSQLGVPDTFTIQGQGITLASGTLTSGNVVIHNN